LQQKVKSIVGIMKLAFEIYRLLQKLPVHRNEDQSYGCFSED